MDSNAAPPKRRYSRQRQAIHEVVVSRGDHPTADDVFEVVRQQLPKISLGTVYRNLEFLASADVIQRLDITGSQRRYDREVEPHCHVRCDVCGCVDDVLGLRECLPFEEVKRRTDYRLTGAQMVFTGICPACR